MSVICVVFSYQHHSLIVYLIEITGCSKTLPIAWYNEQGLRHESYQEASSESSQKERTTFKTTITWSSEIWAIEIQKPFLHRQIWPNKTREKTVDVWGWVNCWQKDKGGCTYKFTHQEKNCIVRYGVGFVIILGCGASSNWGSSSAFSVVISLAD